MDAVSAACIRRLMAGESRESIAAYFVDLGMDNESARKVVESTARKMMLYTPEEAKTTKFKEGVGSMAWGAGCAALGIVITFGSYEAARGGGVYVITGGLIFGGTLMFLRGLVQALKSKIA